MSVLDEIGVQFLGFKIKATSNVLYMTLVLWFGLETEIDLYSSMANWENLRFWICA